MKKIEVSSDKIFGMDRRIFMLFLEPFGLGLLMFLCLFLVVIPKINDSFAKIEEVKIVSKKTKDVNQKISYLQSIDQEEIKNNAYRLASGLLPEKSSYLLLKVIQNAASQLNYNIDNFSISMGDVKGEDDSLKESSFDKIPVGINLVGPGENYLKLAKVLERSLPIMSINKYDMSLARDGVVTIKLDVSAYFMKDISELKLENLTLADLTLSQEESNLLTAIGEYSEMTVDRVGIGVSGDFVKYERVDPFFTP